MKRKIIIGLLMCLSLLAGMIPGVTSVTATTMDVLFDGTINLTPGGTFQVTAYNLNSAGTTYTVNQTTPLGALNAAAAAASPTFTYLANDKKMTGTSPYMLLDNIGTYNYNSPGKWYAYVNNIYKDGYSQRDDAVNLSPVEDGDHVDFYYAAGITTPSDLAAVEAAATAAVNIIASVGTSSPSTDVLFNGTINLTPGGTFQVTAYTANATGTTYTVNQTTPLGALNAAAAAASPTFTYAVSDKKMATKGYMLLDDIGSYQYNSPGKWYAYVNDVYRDGYATAVADAVNLFPVVDGDHVDFYYAEGISDPSDLAAVEAAATAAVNILASVGTPPPSIDVLFDGTVNLTPGATFQVTAYTANATGTTYTANQTTPLGALNAAAAAASPTFTYAVSDKKMATKGYMLIDDIGSYQYNNPGKWYAYVNDVYRDGYATAIADAVNLFPVVDGDHIDFYYAEGITTPSDLAAVEAAATAAVMTVVSTMDVLFNGSVYLAPGGTFQVTAYTANATGTTYTVNQTTPLGALNAASAAASPGFTYVVSDKKMATKGYMLLDNIGTYNYNSPGKWYAYVNDIYKDGYATAIADAINLFPVVDGDHVDFYYAAGITAPTDIAAVKASATAAVKTFVTTSVIPADWTLQLSGAKDYSITKSYFESALACASSGHQVFWEDSDNNTWGGVPLWFLVGVIDDDPDTGPYHFNFNDSLAAQSYKVNVIASDNWSATLDSADIARNDGYIIANTLNGAPLPMLTQSGKPCWPLFLKGAAVFGGQQVGGVVRIALSDMPTPHPGWTLQMLGDIGDTITQTEFEEALACPSSPHYRQWTDKDNNVWSGVPLWVLLGTVDDIETGNHWTFNDTVASENYTVKVTASDNFSKSFSGLKVASSDNYIIANELNDAVLPDNIWPLRLVGPGVTKTDGSLGGSAVGKIVKIELLDLETPPPAPGSWNLAVTGKVSDNLTEAEFEAALACPTEDHTATWTDKDGHVWSGMPLWRLAAWVDDRQPYDFNFNQAQAGYTINVIASDGYTKSFTSTDVARSNNYIIANMYDNAPLGSSIWPLRLVGAGVAKADGSLTGASVGKIAEIELADFKTTKTIPHLHIIKYAADRTTIVSENTSDYMWMQDNLPVIGDGTTVYRYEGLTMNPADRWDPAETYPGGYKIENAVKGTRIRDLCDLVGGMGSGTDIYLIASDGYTTILPYSSIYTNPAVQARQGDAILAWWADGKYVPYYYDGMRLFFTPDGDHVYGQWDMHETLAEKYWHYYYESSEKIFYPSCAGTSAKYVTTIKIYTVPESDWTLALDGTDIGGLQYNVAKTYFEDALACQQGANHKATYTDSQSNVWEGMPFWFLAGFVDDADQHSNNAFNDALAQAGYNVVITSSDGSSVTLASQDIAHSSNYIIANSVNGDHIPDADADWPLRLVGVGVNSQQSIGAIISIELKRIGTQTTSGGGGGGGGGTTSTTRLVEYTNENGKFVIDANAKSIDGRVVLDLPKGTTATNNAGSRLTSLSIKQQTAPPQPPDNCKFICLTYDLGPTGATFDPPINLTFKYNESQVPAGVAEEDLVIATWQDGAWVPLEGCIVDPANNTITAPISHFSLYTSMAFTSPAEFQVSDLTVTPSEVAPGKTVTVSLTVTNTGDLAGEYTTELRINNTLKQSQVFTLKGGASQSISFTISPDTAGAYVVDVNGLSGRYTVIPPTTGTVAEVNVPDTPTKTTPAAAPAPVKPSTLAPSQPALTTSTQPTNTTQPAPSATTNWWLIIGVVVAIVIIGLAVMFLTRKRSNKGTSV